MYTRTRERRGRQEIAGGEIETCMRKGAENNSGGLLKVPKRKGVDGFIVGLLSSRGFHRAESREMIRRRRRSRG